MISGPKTDIRVSHISEAAWWLVHAYTQGGVSGREESKREKEKKEEEDEVEGEDEEGADGSVFFAAKWQRARANRVRTSAATSQEYKRTTDSQATGHLLTASQSARVSSFLCLFRLPPTSQARSLFRFLPYFPRSLLTVRFLFRFRRCCAGSSGRSRRKEG